MANIALILIIILVIVLIFVIIDMIRHVIRFIFGILLILIILFAGINIAAYFGQRDINNAISPGRAFVVLSDGESYVAAFETRDGTAVAMSKAAVQNSSEYDLLVELTPAAMEELPVDDISVGVDSYGKAAAVEGMFSKSNSFTERSEFFAAAVLQSAGKDSYYLSKQYLKRHAVLEPVPYTLSLLAYVPFSYKLVRSTK